MTTRIILRRIGADALYVVDTVLVAYLLTIIPQILGGLL